MASKIQSAAVKGKSQTRNVAPPASTKGARLPSTGPGAIVANQLASTIPPTIQRTDDNLASMTMKNYRTSPDMENFFRFIYENDLRIEALGIIDEIFAQRIAKRKKN